MWCLSHYKRISERKQRETIVNYDLIDAEKRAINREEGAVKSSQKIKCCKTLKNQCEENSEKLKQTTGDLRVESRS